MIKPQAQPVQLCMMGSIENVSIRSKHTFKENDYVDQASCYRNAFRF